MVFYLISILLLNFQVYGKNSTGLGDIFSVPKGEKETQKIIPTSEEKTKSLKKPAKKNYQELKYRFNRDSSTSSSTDKIPQTVIKQPKPENPSSSGGGGGKTKHSNPPSDASVADGPPPKTLPKLWPMCIFVDKKLKNINSLLKDTVDMAAKCGVAVAAFPQYIENYPNDPDKLKKLLREKCNAIEALSDYGVTNASVMAVLSTNSIHLKMCKAGDPKYTKYCSEFSADPGPGMKFRLLNQGRWGGKAPSGESAVSIVGPSGLDPVTFATAALCQPLLNYPPGYAAGNNCGGVDEGYASSGVGGKKGWSSLGCERMREMANPNKLNWRYSSSQKLYIPPSTSNMHFFDLYGDRKIFPTSGDGKSSSMISTTHGSSGGASANGGGINNSSIVGSNGSMSNFNNLPIESIPQNRISNAISQPEDFFKNKDQILPEDDKHKAPKTDVNPNLNAPENSKDKPLFSDKEPFFINEKEIERQQIIPSSTSGKEEPQQITSSDAYENEETKPTFSSSQSSSTSSGLDKNFFEKSPPPNTPPKSSPLNP